MPDEDIKVNNSEIDQALKEFEEKSRMEDSKKNPVVEKNLDAPKSVRLVMKYSGGIIKDQKQAEHIILGILIIIFAASFYFFYVAFGKTPTPPPVRNIYGI